MRIIARSCPRGLFVPSVAVGHRFTSNYTYIIVLFALTKYMAERVGGRFFFINVAHLHPLAPSCHTQYFYLSGIRSVLY